MNGTSGWGDSLRGFFVGDSFMPHGHCYFWKPDLLALHVLSDVTIAFAYFGISLLLYLLVRRVRLPFSPMVLSFGAFIFACGLTHLLEVWNVWHGAYWLAGGMKALTAVASAATLLFLFRALPALLSLARQSQLSEQRRIELEAKAVELERLSSFRSIAEMLPQIVWTANADGVRDYFNQRWADYAGIGEGLPGSGEWQVALHPEDRRRADEAWQQAVRSGTPFELEYRLRHAVQGIYRWHLGRAVPILDGAGRVTKWFGTAADIHDQKLRVEEAQRVSEFHERLVGIVSHDVRSPVAAILATTDQLLSDQGLESVMRRRIDRLHRSGLRISRLIDLLVDFTRARLGGGIPMRLAPTNLTEVSRRGLEEMQAVHPGRALRLSVEGDVEGLWDADRLGQIISNLLDNAVKYSPADSPIEIRLSGGTEEVWLEVRNQGAEIPSSQLPSLFEPFRRGPQTDDTVKLSLGLGLFIVREVARGHGGEVQVTSGSGDGTTFRVQLPRRPRTVQEQAPVRAPAEALS